MLLVVIGGGALRQGVGRLLGTPGLSWRHQQESEGHGGAANLHTLPPEEVARRYVEFMGGAEATLEKARSAYERGEYRWVAEVVNHVVFADPTNAEARGLQADALEQMGYQSESGPWRNFYLTGAKELREGVVELPAPNTASPDSVRAMSLDLFFNYLGVRLNGPKAGDTTLTLNLVFTDTGNRAILELANGALNHVLGHTTEEADATVTLTRSALDRVIVDEKTLAEEIGAGEVSVEPDSAPLEKLVSLLDTFEFWFPIFEP